MEPTMSTLTLRISQVSKLALDEAGCHLVKVLNDAIILEHLTGRLAW